jgi:signal transduction histidine kinase
LISGDPILLDEAFRELFRNADNVGATLKDISLLERNLRKDGACVEVVVRDEGPGVPDEFKKRIFDPHFKIRKGGTGLGLYRVRRIVEAHGGEVSERGFLGKGAHFCIVFPLESKRKTY